MMTVHDLGTVLPIHLVGESHCIGYNDIAFQPEWSKQIFACHSKYIQQISASNASSADGQINPLLVAGLREAGLLTDRGHPEYLTRNHSVAFINGLPLVAPPLVLFYGEGEVQSVYSSIPDEYDFQLSGDTVYGVDAKKSPIPVRVIRAKLEELLGPFLQAAQRLLAAGFCR